MPSMYDASVPVFVRSLRNLRAILDKGESFAREKGLDPNDLVEARLFEDMSPLTSQIQRASDSAKGAAARLTGTDNPSFPDEEKDFSDLRARLDKTIAFLEAFKPSQFGGSETRPVTLKFGPRSADFTGQGYLLDFALPNFFFHVTTAYAILRHNGVGIGKIDYLGGL